MFRKVTGYFAVAVSYTRKTFMRLKLGAKVIKLFTVVSYEFLLKARVLAPDKPFQLSLLFAGKASSLP